VTDVEVGACFRWLERACRNLGLPAVVRSVPESNQVQNPLRWDAETRGAERLGDLLVLVTRWEAMAKISGAVAAGEGLEAVSPSRLTQAGNAE
jgi:hypothetical protein